jgi:ribokinase
MKKLCVTGSLHLDVILNATHIPSSDETVPGTDVNYVFGGKGGNQALAADRYGASVYFVGRIGEDAFGKKLLETLGESSIDISQLQLGNESSGMSVAIVDKVGNYGAVIVSAANLKIDKNRFSIDKDTGILLLQNEICEEINILASQKAKEIGSEVWLNAAPSRKISPQLFSHVDVLIMNSIEAKFYKGDLESSQANHLTKILTLGSKGLEIYLPGKPKKRFPAYPVKVLSTHGAGDTFIGSLAAKRLKGKSLETALEYAQAAAALHVSTPLEERTNLSPNDVVQFLRLRKNIA